MIIPDNGLGRHLIISLKDQRAIAATPEERRILARVALTQARQDRLLAFRYADTHIHLFCKCGRTAGSRLLQRIESALKQLLHLPVGFDRPYNEPLRNGEHQRNLFRYILNQHARHGLAWDPLHEASNLPDLLGLRPLGGYTRTNMECWLPRVGTTQLLEWLDTPQLQLRNHPLDRLAEATRVASCLLDLRGSRREPRAARRAAVRVGSANPSHTVSAIAAALELSRSAVHELRSGPVDPRLTRAIQLQLGFMEHIAGRGVSLPCSTQRPGWVAGVR